ncbi:MAG: hypothetical protein V4506_02910 [Bacteroidota bacterium]
MQYSFRFFVSWIVAAVLMYGAFYFWHGIFLNDLNRITFSKVLFLFLAALVYLIISYVLYRTFETKILVNLITAPLLRGAVSGILLGLVLFSIITVLGISFTKHISMKYLVADCAWQVAEQLVGGIIIGIGKSVLYEPKPEDLRHA